MFFQLFDTSERSRTTLWQPKDDGWRVRTETVHGKRVGKTSGMIIEYQGAMAKAPRCLESTHTERSCHSKSSSSSQRRREAAGS